MGLTGPIFFIVFKWSPEIYSSLVGGFPETAFPNN